MSEAGIVGSEKKKRKQNSAYILVMNSESGHEIRKFEAIKQVKEHLKTCPEAFVALVKGKQLEMVKETKVAFK